MNRNDLQRPSKDDLIDLVLRLQRPDKSSPSVNRSANMTRSSFPLFNRSFGGIAGSPFAASIAARKHPRLYRLSQWERLSASASTRWRSI
jgi:hypothetical protein